MLYAYLGTDRRKTRDAMNATIQKVGKDRTRITITDAHTVGDLEASLQGGGMFALPRLVIFDGISANPEMRERLLEELPNLKSSDDIFFILEEKLDAVTKRAVGKYAEKVEQFDVAKGEKDNAIFALRFALEKGDKKALWVGLQREYINGKSAEAVHGFLFWAAKQIVMSARNENARKRGEKLLIELAELPHESRRKGFDLEYALERFVLSQT